MCHSVRVMGKSNPHTVRIHLRHSRDSISVPDMPSTRARASQVLHKFLCALVVKNYTSRSPDPGCDVGVSNPDSSEQVCRHHDGSSPSLVYLAISLLLPTSLPLPTRLTRCTDAARKGASHTSERGRLQRASARLVLVGGLPDGHTAAAAKNSTAGPNDPPAHTPYAPAYCGALYAQNETCPNCGKRGRNVLRRSSDRTAISRHHHAAASTGSEWHVRLLVGAPQTQRIEHPYPRS